MAHIQIWVPHLRDGFIVDKVGNRATRDPYCLTARFQACQNSRRNAATM
jgi:hypothetical protein